MPARTITLVEVLMVPLVRLAAEPLAPKKLFTRVAMLTIHPSVAYHSARICESPNMPMADQSG